jgi:glycyl-tRNA synthetase beta chain
VKILADLPELTGLDARLTLGPLLARAAKRPAVISASDAVENDSRPPEALFSFMADRLSYLLEQRGFDVRSVRAVMHGGIEQVSPVDARRKLEALSQMSGSEALIGVAMLLKRAKNITKGVQQVMPLESLRRHLTHPSEERLAEELATRAPAIRAAAARSDYRDAFTQVSQLQPAVAKFFDDVLVMAEDETLRAARLALVATLRDLILSLADISEIVADKES